jgi:hypothetical protein
MTAHKATRRRPFIYSMREPAECPKSPKQHESSEDTECDDYDGLPLRLRHLTLSITITDKMPTLRHVAERHRRAVGLLSVLHHSVYDSN